jgi:hypothetical protein
VTLAEAAADRPIEDPQRALEDRFLPDHDRRQGVYFFPAAAAFLAASFVMSSSAIEAGTGR